MKDVLEEVRGIIRNIKIYPPGITNIRSKCNGNPAITAASDVLEPKLTLHGVSKISLQSGHYVLIFWPDGGAPSIVLQMSLNVAHK